MLWANLIRANISSLVLFLELDSGVTGSLTVAASPGNVSRVHRPVLRKPAERRKHRSPLMAEVGHRVSKDLFHSWSLCLSHG